MKKELFVTREVEFSAAHRLYREDLSDEKNFELFGKCANPYGHGHNYLLEVTFRGEVSPDTGMVVHFATLKRILEEIVVNPLDHRHLNHDVPFLAGVLPTSENLVFVLWDRIASAFGQSTFRLHRLRLSSSSRNWVDYYGPQGGEKHL